MIFQCPAVQELQILPAHLWREVHREKISCTGSLRMVGTKRIIWQDNQDHKVDGAVFVPLMSPLGGGL